MLNRFYAIRQATNDLKKDPAYLEQKQKYERKALIIFARIVAIFTGIYGIVLFFLQLSKHIPIDGADIYLILFGALSYVFSLFAQYTLTEHQFVRTQWYIAAYSSIAVLTAFFLWLFCDSISMFLFIMIMVCTSQVWAHPKKYVIFNLTFTALEISIYIAYPPEDVCLILYVLDCIIVAIFAIGLNIAHSEEHYRMYALKHQLEIERDTDALTGLHNRKALSEDYRSCLEKYPFLGVIVLDIDNFKQANDTFGHETGDRVLIHLAHVMEDNFRSQDYIARLGGDEFVILMPCAEDQCNLIPTYAENLLRQFPVCAVRGEIRVQVTLSIGVYTYPITPSLTLSRVLAETDRLLYVAKNAGRNRLMLCHADSRNIREVQNTRTASVTDIQA